MFSCIECGHGWINVSVFFWSDGGLSLSICVLPKEICNLYILQLAPFTSVKNILIKAVQKLCVCILPNVSVSVEILSCGTARILEFNLSPLTGFTVHHSFPLFEPCAQTKTHEHLLLPPERRDLNALTAVSILKDWIKSNIGDTLFYVGRNILPYDIEVMFEQQGHWIKVKAKVTKCHIFPVTSIYMLVFYWNTMVIWRSVSRLFNKNIIWLRSWPKS